MSGTAGSVSDITLTLTNSGTADIEGAAMSATAPTGWKTDFDTPERHGPGRQDGQRRRPRDTVVGRHRR